jgi:L-alanine-DL-glutamate epimerase-like enolase superfamily enzyme
LTSGPPRSDTGATLTQSATNPQPATPVNAPACRVETYALAVPLRRPIADSTYHRPTWTVPVVEIETEDGVVGTGISGVHAGADLMCTTIDRYFAPQLLGRPVDDIRGIWTRLYWSDIHWVGRAGVVHMAQSMVDQALWDIAAQRAGLPLWQLLGGHHRELASYNTDGGWLNWTVEELVDDMTSLVEQGWSRVKMKVGKPDWREDVERMRAVRAALPDDVILKCDVNQRWDLATAMTMLPYLEEVGMAWLEEPLHPDDVEGHRKLQAATRIPVALGETVYSHQAFSSFIRADAVRVVQVDVTRVGGITEWLQVAAEATAAGLWVVPHAGDMMVVARHLVAATFAEKPAMIEWIPWTLEAFEEPAEVERGIVKLPTTPGASTRVRPEARRAWAIEGVGSTTR